MAEYYCTIGRLTDEQLLIMIKKVYSKAGLLRELGLRPVGGNYSTINKLLERLKPDISHWTGQGWSIGYQHKDLTLELEHIDGDRFNHTPSNVCLLCPNCHSQTATWRRRKDC